MNKRCIHLTLSITNTVAVALASIPIGITSAAGLRWVITAESWRQLAASGQRSWLGAEVSPKGSSVYVDLDLRNPGWGIQWQR